MRARAKYQGVTAFTGMPGGGKTYALAETGLRALERGRRVACNAGFDLRGAEVYGTFDEFCDAIALGYVVLLDEAPLYFNARKWAEFPDSVWYGLTQIRHDSASLFYSTMHEDFVDKVLRIMTFNWWVCHAITGRVLHRSLYAPQEFRRASAKPMRRRFVIVREKVAAAYDTTAKVAVSERTRARIAAGVAESERWSGVRRAGGAPAGGTGAGVPESPGLGTLPRSWAASAGGLVRLVEDDGAGDLGGSGAAESAS